MVNNLIVVEVVVASKRPMNFILDNATSNPIIFHKNYIKGLSLALGNKISVRGAGDGKAVGATTISGTSLHLSGVATDRIGMVVLDRNPFSKLKGNQKTIHGVLGSTLFRSFIVEIDYPNQVLRLHQHKSFSPAANYQAVPMQVITGRPYLSALVQGQTATVEMNLMLDLGFNNSLLLQLSDSLLQKMMTKAKTAKVGVGYNGILRGKKGLIPSVLIGPGYYEEVTTIAPFTQSLPQRELTPGIPRMGSIGNTMFKDTSIIFNYPERTFYIACPILLLAQKNI
ncbi:hypothetical protein [Tunicatimonas pelagia]|uniref:hypothetical protein n=1 Tax=Tunicatimonas pelagia TaxID=931531 RepID=UPI0026652073|nr:hypothetical protein [Tunicatimonas pelagia]WKN41754.1 hypothetical protein P0M28_22205 [Tunicatimonas pelagia]